MSHSTFRVMTYNVHSCRGLDGRVDPLRIARVIEMFDPDLVALQELDVNRASSHRTDQPLAIAQELRLHCHFQPAVAVEGEHYGIAIFSRHPFEVKKAEHLPRYPQRTAKWKGIAPFKYLYEPREALWASVQLPSTTVSFINTHLGLRRRERRAQVEALLSEQWLGGVRPQDPLIVCGDFNMGPRSSEFRRLHRHFAEVKRQGLRKRKTFFSGAPLFEIDHIFYHGPLTVKGIQIPRNALTRTASDHLPVVADFKIG